MYGMHVYINPDTCNTEYTFLACLFGKLYSTTYYLIYFEHLK